MAGLINIFAKSAGIINGLIYAQAAHFVFKMKSNGGNMEVHYLPGCFFFLSPQVINNVENIFLQHIKMSQ